MDSDMFVGSGVVPSVSTHTFHGDSMTHHDKHASSTLDEQAALAAVYQRDLDCEFARMRNAEGRPLYIEEDVPLASDAFKHIALLPWMQHMLTLMIADNPVFGLRLPMPGAWRLAAAWDYDEEYLDGTPAEVPTLSSHIKLEAKSASSDLTLYVIQYASLTHDINLNPHLSFAYRFELRVKGSIDIRTMVETSRFKQELTPMDAPCAPVYALGRTLESVVALLRIEDGDSQ